jgi:aminotransferase
MINIFQPNLREEELALVAEVFRSNWIGKGDPVLQFEQAFAASLRSDAAHFTTTSSCTEGLFLAPELFQLGAGDEVIAPSLSFIAVGSAIVASGAKLVLCDVDPRTLNPTAAHIAALITPRTKGVYITHYGGVPCEMDEIVSLCRERGIVLIEDAACAVRSFYKGRACGTIGDMGIWSFDAMKTVCTGDGGMLYFSSLEKVNDAKEQLYLGLPNRQKSGIDSSAAGNERWWEYQITRPGRRAIMNNIAGAIGLAQMKKLDGFLARRRAIDAIYRRELASLSWLTLPPDIPAHCESSYYFFWIQLERRDALAHHLKKNGVYSTFRYWPLHRVDYFGLRDAALPHSNWAADHTLCIPLHQALTDEDVAKVIASVKSFAA